MSLHVILKRARCKYSFVGFSKFHVPMPVTVTVKYSH